MPIYKTRSTSLPQFFPVSSHLNDIPVGMLHVDWRRRMTLPEIRRVIEALDNFYSEGVVFEGSMTRCSWEAGMDIDSDSSTKGDDSLYETLARN
jgi:serine/threonine-protein kinase ULK1